MLRAIRRPSATARGSIENWSLEQDDVGDALGDLAPRSHRDRQPRLLERRDVVDPVADHRREPAALARARRTSAFFCSGRMRQKIVLRSATSAELRCVLGQVGPLDHPGVLRARRPRRRPRSPSGGVARDQLQVDLLLAHELDRLGGVGAQRLLEHDQRQRLELRRRLRPPGRSGSAPGGLAEGDDPAPGRGVLLERSRCSAGRQRPAPPAAASTSGAPST